MRNINETLFSRYRNGGGRKLSRKEEEKIKNSADFFFIKNEIPF